MCKCVVVQLFEMGLLALCASVTWFRAQQVQATNNGKGATSYRRIQFILAPYTSFLYLSLLNPVKTASTNFLKQSSIMIGWIVKWVTGVSSSFVTYFGSHVKRFIEASYSGEPWQEEFSFQIPPRPPFLRAHSVTYVAQFDGGGHSRGGWGGTQAAFCFTNDLLAPVGVIWIMMRP